MFDLHMTFPLCYWLGLLGSVLLLLDFFCLQLVNAVRTVVQVFITPQGLLGRAAHTVSGLMACVFQPCQPSISNNGIEETDECTDRMLKVIVD